MRERWRRLWARAETDSDEPRSAASTAASEVEQAEFREFMSADGGAVDEVFGERLRRRLRELVMPGTWKHGIASRFDAAGLNAAGARIQSQLLWPYARALNYHDVSPRLAPAFEAQLRSFARDFTPVGPAELRELHAGEWRHPKPGLLLTFDDGLRSHADVAAPLLEKYGFCGWFNVPVGFVDTPVAEQREYARLHQIDCDSRDLPGERIALSWRDLRRLDGPHEICCHTFSHRRLGPRLTAEELQLEIVEAKRRLEEGLGHTVRGFAWVGGEEWAYTREAAELIEAAGFEFSFMTNNAPIRPHGARLQIQRTNVEAHFDPAFLRFCLSGFYDLIYLRKRRRVNRLTAARAA